MVLTTIIARIGDGLPLTASVQDDEQSGRSVIEYQNQALQLFTKLTSQSPNRSSIQTGPYLFHYLIETEVCYLVLCEQTFSKRLAFQYLEDLSTVFNTQYGKTVLTESQAYCFMEFAAYMQKAQKSVLDAQSRLNPSALNNEEGQQIMVHTIDAVLQQGSAIYQPNAWSHAHSGMLSVQPPTQVGMHVSEGNDWQWTNGDQNGQSDPWNWGYPSTPSPSNTPNPQPPAWPNNQEYSEGVSGGNQIPYYPVDAVSVQDYSANPNVIHPHQQGNAFSGPAPDQHQHYASYQQQWDSQSYAGSYTQAQTSWDTGQAWPGNYQWTQPACNQVPHTSDMPEHVNSVASDSINFSNVVSQMETKRTEVLDNSVADHSLSNDGTNYSPDSEVQLPSEEVCADSSVNTSHAMSLSTSFYNTDTTGAEGVSSDATVSQSDERDQLTPVPLHGPLAGHAPHLFQRSDSWLSGSSLQTIHNSLSGSQDTLDASHYMPQETLDTIRQHMQDMTLHEKTNEGAVSEHDYHTTNQEVPTEPSSSVGNLDQGDNLGLPPVSSSQPTANQLNSSPQEAEGEDGVRQPPDGAAAIRPLNIAAGSAVGQPSDSATVPQSPVVTEIQSSGDGSTEVADSNNSVQERLENVENLQTDADAEGSGNVAAVPEPYIHHVNIYASMIGPREGSPFRPLPKSAGTISSVIQRETLEVQPSPLSLPVSTVEDNCANLEMTPDNVERPSDLELPVDIQKFPQSDDQGGVAAALPREHLNRVNRESYNNSPSTTLWQNPEPQKGNLFLVPATSESSVQQNILIVPHLSDQQEMLDNPLGKSPSPVTALTATQLENHENVNIGSSNVSDKTSSTNSSSSIRSEPLRDRGPPPTNSIKPNELHAQLPPNKHPGSIHQSSSVPLNAPPPNSTTAALSLSDSLGGGGDSIHSHDPGQRPPVPGLGPTTQPVRATSEPPLPPPAHLPPRERHDRDKARGDRNESWHDSEYDRHSQDDGPLNREDDRDSNHRHDDRRDRYNARNAEGHRERGGGRSRDYPDDRQEHRDPRKDYADPYYSDSHDSRRDRQNEYRERYRNYDDDPYYRERDRSRPSSRTSDYDRSHEPGSREKDRERQQYHERPHSRGGYDSDRENGGYYKKTNYDYRDNYRDYNRDPRYQHKDYARYEQDAYYRRYYDDYVRYNNYNYGYYDELYRNDPRYNDPRYRMQYDPRYREYYAQYGYDGSERRSVQSGRSSVNDELQKENEKFSQQFHQQGSTDQLNSSQGFDQSPIYQDYSSGYYNESYQAEEVIETPVPRLTPAKFQTPHIKVQFTATGQLVIVLPNNPTDGQPATVEIHELQSMFEASEEMEALKSFPGPLIKGQTHKNDVIQFCVNKAKEARDDMNLHDKDSCILIWDLLNLLVRQNGTVVGTDIAELLLKEHEIIAKPADEVSSEPFFSDGTSSVETTSPDEGVVVTKDRSVICRVTEDTVTRKFREYLLFGRKKEALEKAMKNGLWGHALFLASKMDNRTYASVMTRFANSLTLNDPLQTLYQLMSGRQPAAVTCVAEEKWGDWRPHLAMILSNTSHRPDLDRRSIATLGDTLASRGCLHASQFCYLMAELDFGTYSSKSSKLVLLSSNHSLPFSQFATNEAIQCTEVYEYAQSLANSQFMLPHFQSYRFIYATRLAEYGFTQEALHYCEVISSFVCKMPALFHPEMVSQVYELGSKLKYYDPYYTSADGEQSDLADPEWLMQLNNILQGYHTGMIQPISEEFGSYNYYAGSSLNVTTASDAGDATTTQQALSTGMAYDNSSSMQQSDSCQTPDPAFSSYPYSQMNPNNYSSGIQPGLDSNETYSATTGQLHQQPSIGQYDGGYGAGTSLVNTMAPPTQSYYTPSTDGIKTSTPDDGYREVSHPDLTANAATTNGDYWDMYGKPSPPPSPVKPAPLVAADFNNRRPSTSSNKSHGKPEGKKDVIKKGGGSSWLGGIFGKLMPKQSNQMKLPDDRNPTIVWDASKNKWVNNGEDEEETPAGPAAPPMDSEIMGRSPVATSSVPSIPSGPVDYNKFRRPGGLGTRQHYVDVLAKGSSSSTGAALPQNLIPGMENQANPMPQFFIPTSVSNSTNEYADFASHVGQAQVGNPASRPGSPHSGLLDAGDSELSRSSSQSSLAREVQRYMAPFPADPQVEQTVGSTHLPQAMPPMMFNPSQMVPPNPTTTTAKAGRLNAYGRRYPR